MASEKADTRRRYGATMKAQVVTACDEPGASVANKVAMAHGISANVVHRWRQLVRKGKAMPAKAGEFIALSLMVVPKAAPTSADIRVERHVRGKWACAHCPRDRQGAGHGGLMTHVVVAKYIDHQPLCQQEGILGLAGFAVPRSTQAEWIGALGVELAPLVQAMRADPLGRRVLHADETPWRCSR